MTPVKCLGSEGRERKREGQMQGCCDGNWRTHQAHSSCQTWGSRMQRRENFTLTHLSQRTLHHIRYQAAFENHWELKQIWDFMIIMLHRPFTLREMWGLFELHYELNWDHSACSSPPRLGICKWMPVADYQAGSSGDLCVFVALAAQQMGRKGESERWYLTEDNI